MPILLSLALTVLNLYFLVVLMGWSLHQVTRRSARTGSESITSRFLGRSDAGKRTLSNDATCVSPPQLL
jgi:hypothetical protein